MIITVIVAAASAVGGAVAAVKIPVVSAMVLKVLPAKKVS